METTTTKNTLRLPANDALARALLCAGRILRASGDWTTSRRCAGLRGRLGPALDVHVIQRDSRAPLWTLIALRRL